MHSTVEYIHQHGQALRAEHTRCDKAGKLTATTKEILLKSGGMRLLQSQQNGGYEASPGDFFEWVRTVGRYNPSAGWVAGVVGIHPWQISLVDTQLQAEIYAQNPDTWIASPYAPQGRAVREGDGFQFSGRWQYSTGTDHCDWVVLGGMVVDKNGARSKPPEIRHFFLPRSDYEIIEGSWQVMGLSGTGSKDIQIDGAYVPAYRSVLHRGIMEGDYAERQHNNLYRLPFGCVFSGAIAAGTLGIAQGAIDQYRDYVETRVSMSGVAGKSDPRQLEALAEVEADLSAGVLHIDAMFDQWLIQLELGNPITKAQRMEFRRNQVRAVQRVLFGIDNLYARSGSSAIWTTKTLEHFWRDLRTAGTHICNTAETVYHAASSYSLGTEDAAVALY
ncbi:MAG: acyl-CoA dehydrogenase [Pseudomonadota bacterium]